MGLIQLLIWLLELQKKPFLSFKKFLLIFLCLVLFEQNVYLLLACCQNKMSNASGFMEIYNLSHYQNATNTEIY